MAWSGQALGRWTSTLVFQRDDAGGDLQQAQPQRVELGDAPGRARRHQAAQRPQQPVGAGVQHQAQLVGAGAVSRTCGRRRGGSSRT